MNSIKVHNEARDQFLRGMQTYNWNTDPAKLKQIRDLAVNVPKGIRYREPNFVQIKNGLSRCDNLIKTFLSYQNYNGCAEAKKLKDDIEKLAQNYAKNPEGNEQCLN